MSLNDLSKVNSKDATLKLRLRADSGYSSDTECRVSPNQWTVICAVVENEAEAKHLIASLAHIRALDAAANVAGALLTEREKEQSR